MFPEQDFLADAHRGKWHSLSWKYNAYKTMRYWHGSFWRDDEVVNLHYIIDKPWSRRPVRSQGGGGRYIVDHGDKYSQPLECELGKPSHLADAVTHGWWWDEFEEMRDDMLSAEAVGDDKARKVRTYLERFVAQ
jgi:lipopolysaccharide biosynthesis glycosyltransferase